MREFSSMHLPKSFLRLWSCVHFSGPLVILTKSREDKAFILQASRKLFQQHAVNHGFRRLTRKKYPGYEVGSKCANINLHQALFSPTWYSLIKVTGLLQPNENLHPASKILASVAFLRV